MLLFLNQYHLFGGIVASLLGLLLLLLISQFNKGNNNNNNNKEINDEKEKDMTSSSSECASHDGPDVIVVGAGVAGSALAYTLGKIVWMKLMLNGYLGMLSLSKEKIPNCLIPWKNTIQMLLGGASIMGGLFKGCERKLHLCPRKSSKSKFSLRCVC